MKKVACVYNLVDTGFYIDSKNCTFAHWYYGYGMERFGDYTEYRKVEGYHDSFHKHIEKVLEVLKKENPADELIRRRDEILHEFNEVEENLSKIFNEFDNLIKILEGR